MRFPFLRLSHPEQLDIERFASVQRWINNEQSHHDRAAIIASPENRIPATFAGWFV